MKSHLKLASGSGALLLSGQSGYLLLHFPDTPDPGGSSHRRGAVWEPRVDLVIEEARQRRELETLSIKAAKLSKQLTSKRPAKRQMPVVEAQAIRATLERVLNQREAVFKAVKELEARREYEREQEKAQEAQREKERLKQEEDDVLFVMRHMLKEIKKERLKQEEDDVLFVVRHILK